MVPVTEKRLAMVRDSIADMWGMAVALSCDNKAEAQKRCEEFEIESLVLKVLGNKQQCNIRDVKLIFAAACREALRIMGEPATLE